MNPPQGIKQYETTVGPAASGQEEKLKNAVKHLCEREIKIARADSIYRPNKKNGYTC